jgi:methyltransferase (TIGR00027 family)
MKRGVHTFEVNTVSTQQAKIKSLRKAGIRTSETTFVSCDFTAKDWRIRLQENDMDISVPTLFVWEGVTMYLPRDDVKLTIKNLGKCAPGSCVGFDYVDRTWAMADEIRNIMKRWGEPWLFGMTGDEPQELISDCANEASCRMLILDHVKYIEIIKRYLTKHCDGRPIGFLDDFGGFVLVSMLETN